MKTTKRLTIIFLVFLLITSIGVTTSVSAGSLLEDKLEQIKSVYSDGKYFTRSGNICNSNQSSDCELNNIPSRGGLPSGSQVATVCGDAWSCCSFAKYVFYCLFEVSPLDSSYTNVSNLKQGDYIKFIPLLMENTMEYILMKMLQIGMFMIQITLFPQVIGYVIMVQLVNLERTLKKLVTQIIMIK